MQPEFLPGSTPILDWLTGRLQSMCFAICVGYAICHMIWTASVPHVDMSQKPTPMNQGQIAQWLEHLVYIQKVLGSIPSLAISLSHPVCHLYIRACSVLCSLSLSPCVRSLWCFPNSTRDHLAEARTSCHQPKC